MDEKSCANCKQTKFLAEFYKDKREKDGRYPSCKTCHGERMKKWRSANPEKQNELSEAWRNAHPERVSVYNKRFREQNPTVKYKHLARYKARHPEKIAARNAVRRALKNGSLVKADSCEDCGQFFEDARKLHGHHEDYSKHLTVEWLCRKCHMRRHYPDKPRPLDARAA